MFCSFLFLGVFLLFNCSTASQNYGCLFKPLICDQKTHFCEDDGYSGKCVRYDQLYNDPINKAKASKAESPYFENINLDDKKNKISKETYADLVGLVKRVQDYLKENGIEFSDLSQNEIEKLAVVISYIHEKEIKANQKSRSKRLLKMIMDAKKMLINEGINFTELSDQQIDIISKQLAVDFQQAEKKRLQEPQKLHKPSSKVTQENPIANNVVPYQNSNMKLKNGASANIDEIPKTQKDDSAKKNNIPDEDFKIKNKELLSKNSNSAVVASQSNENEISEKSENIQKNQNLNFKNEKLFENQPQKDLTADRKPVKNDIKDLSKDRNSDNDVSFSEDMSNVKVDKADQQELTYIVIVIVVVIIIILIIIGSFVFYCMKSVEKRNKLIGAASEQSDDDYQELCRQHYASRNSETNNTKEPLLKDGVGSVTSQSRVFSPVTQRSCHSRISRNSSVSSWGEEPVTNTLDISTAHAILSYMEDHLNNEDRLNAEWLALCSYEADEVSTKCGEKEASRNRYQRALPFDHNRVVLKGTNNPMEGDYINASFIIDNDPRCPVYIAAQGPLSHTIHQFWQMVWEQKCVAIVMLSPLVEDGISQCARYWPDEGSCTYNNFEIHLVSEHVWCEDYLVRSLYSKDLSTGETRTLTQFHFLSWPHNGVPLSPKPMLELRRKVSKCMRGNSPVLIHCDDGVGRTGCYILIDLVVQRMLKGQAKEIDVAATLEHLRDQRKGMLTTKEQLEFSLASVADEANAVLKVLLK